MSEGAVFLLLGAIYVSHEAPRRFRYMFGFGCLVWSVARDYI